ncbi:hypothetical protein [Pseudoduganella namucuonensis]|uniref:hypothetical protein n=1 Tax=Pseudoduganella namucuonensis TaxID=1035707 RepID=UPI0011602BE8|nr:hypothetical protein [Pseudoduganella namucuonensis]
MPAAESLAAMIVKADRLRLAAEARSGHGMSFHASKCTVSGATATLDGAALVNAHFDKKKSSVCFEDQAFNAVLGSFTGKHLVVHQSTAPCHHCCTAYKTWASKIDGAIIVSFDKGYDGSAEAGRYVFSKLGPIYSL